MFNACSVCCGAARKKRRAKNIGEKNGESFSTIFSLAIFRAVPQLSEHLEEVNLQSELRTHQHAVETT